MIGKAAAKGFVEQHKVQHDSLSLPETTQRRDYDAIPRPVATSAAYLIQASNARAEIGRRFAMQKGLDGDAARGFLVATLKHREEALELPRLSAYGMSAADIPRIVANGRGSSMKTNPVALTDEEIARILAAKI